MATRGSTKVTASLLHDSEWINNCFMLPRDPKRGDTKISDNVMQWMYYTSADLKFTNTSLGGNFTVNNPPQFTTFADPPTGRLIADTNKIALESGMSQGMGQYYSEAIDDNAQRVSMRFGVPEYKGLITFFTGFYSAAAATLGNEGRTSNSLFYLIGRLVGAVVAIPLQIIMAAGKMVKFFLNRPSTKYYWLKPAMPLYWNRVNLVANRLAAEMGLVPDSYQKDDGSDPLQEYDLQETTTYNGLKSYSFEMVKEFMPELFSDSGGIDIYRIVNKTARMSAHAQATLLTQGEGATSAEAFAQSVRKHLQSVNMPSDVISGKPLDEYLKAYHDSVLGAVELPGEDGEPISLIRRNGITDRVLDTAEVDGNGTFGETDVDTAQESREDALGQAPTGAEANAAMKDYAAQDNNILSILRVGAEGELERALGWVGSKNNEVSEYFDAAMTRASEWISFKINANPTESESWDNSSTESDIQNTINGTSKTVRSLAFNFSNFNTGFSMIDEPIKAVRDLVYGTMDSFQISGLLALAGTGQVDIPKRYDDSTSNVFTSVNYTMELRTPYGDPLSIFLNLYLPLLCLMAAALPITHGNQSYGAPMLCELFQRGRATIRLGMIESLSVTRGTGTVGWTKEGLPLGIDISFSVANLSSVMHMPIDTGLQNVLPWNALFADDNVYTDYTAVLSNLTIADQTNPWKKYAINKRRWRIDVDNYFNGARLGNSLADDGLSRLLSTVSISPPNVTTM